MFRLVGVNPALHLLHKTAQGNLIIGISMLMLPVAVVEYNIERVVLQVQRYGALSVVALIVIFHIFRIFLLIYETIILDLIPSSFSSMVLRHDNGYLTRSELVNDSS